jgi:hydroxymethylbilane synthase
MRNRIIRIGSRGSKLALWQSNFVKSLLENRFKEIQIEIKIIKTKGDKILDVPLSKIGDKGLFTKELENKLLEGDIDLAVHSLKDLETVIDKRLVVGAVTKRYKVNDVLIAHKKGMTLKKLRIDARIATGSLRRKAQLLHFNPNFEIIDLRGNVTTRIQKFLKSEWDAIVLARAGVERLGLEKYISSVIPKKVILPAVGQGVLGIECRKDNDEVLHYIRKINDKKTEVEINAERSFLNVLGGGCQVPIGAYCKLLRNSLILEGRILSLDGSISFHKIKLGSSRFPERLGESLAKDMLKAGAKEIIDDIYNSL